MQKRAGRVKEDKNMTPTAKELWNDPAFLQKRIVEQVKYMAKCLTAVVKSKANGTNTTEFIDRQRELFLSASNLQAQYMERLWEITLE